MAILSMAPTDSEEKTPKAPFSKPTSIKTAAFQQTGPGEDLIGNAIKKKLNVKRNGDDLFNNKLLQTKSLQTEKIEFKLAKKDYQLNLKQLQTKYVLLNPAGLQQDRLPAESEAMKSPHFNNSSNSVTALLHSSNDHDLPRPVRYLYPPEKLSLKFHHMNGVGAGLENLGNTCFMNAVLQCLNYTPPLNNFFNSGEHARSCNTSNRCMLCLANNLFRQLKNRGPRGVHREMTLFKTLQSYAGGHMRPYHQHDAHEYLLVFLEALQKSCIRMFAHKEKLDMYTAETSMIGQIFTGVLLNQVKCLNCKMTSKSFQPFKDIQIDVEGTSSITEGLESYMKVERLEGNNAYYCDHCKKKCKALKCFKIEKAPNVLIIMLKRYSPITRLKKVNDPVRYPERLDIRTWMHPKEGPPVSYQLYGMVNHSGATCDSGHYYTFVKSPNGQWYTMNDSQVYQMDKGTAIRSRSVYLLFYLKIDKSEPWELKSLKQSSKHLDKTNAHSNLSGQSHSAVHKKPAAASAACPAAGSATSPAAGSATSPAAIGSKVLPNHKKVEFGIKLKQPISGLSNASNGTPKNPKIVIKIKNNCLVQTGRDVKKAKDDVNPKKSLVPYADEDTSSKNSDSELDNEVKSSDKVNRVKPKVNGVHKNSPLQELSNQKSGDNQNGSQECQTPSLDLYNGLNGNGLPESTKKADPIFTPRSVASSMKNKSNTLTLNIGNANSKTSASASGKWRVSEDCLQSPSRASECSSNASVNSTTLEWTVTPISRGKQHTVSVNTPQTQSQSGTPTPISRGKQHTVSVNTPQTQTQTVTPISRGKHSVNTPRTPPRPATIGGCTKNGTHASGTMSSKLRIDFDLLKMKPINPEEQRKNGIEGSSTQQGIGNEGIGNEEVKKTGRLENVHNPEDDPCPCPVLNENTKKTIENEERSDKEGDAGDKIDTDKDVTVRTLESDQPDQREHQHSKHKKKKKKKKKHRRHDSDSEDKNDLWDTAVCGSRSHGDSHGDGDDDLKQNTDTDTDRKTDRRSSSRSKHSSNKSSHSSDTDTVEHHKKKKKHKHTHHSSDTDSSDEECSKAKQPKVEYEVIEKTKSGEETIDMTGITNKFDEERKHNGSGDVLSVLLGQSTRGYGDGVKSWNGEKSEIDLQVEADMKYERKRRLSDDYEEELDSGRVKKVKKHRDREPSRDNPFQYQQDVRNYQTDKRKRGENFYDYQYGHHDHSNQNQRYHDHRHQRSHDHDHRHQSHDHSSHTYYRGDR